MTAQATHARPHPSLMRTAVAADTLARVLRQLATDAPDIHVVYAIVNTEEVKVTIYDSETPEEALAACAEVLGLDEFSAEYCTSEAGTSSVHMHRSGIPFPGTGVVVKVTVVAPASTVLLTSLALTS